MSRLKSLFVSGFVLLTVLGCVSFSNPKPLNTPVNQSPQSDNGQPMQALLNEVHQLRLAIQRSNLNTYYAQVTLERLRLQQQRVERLNEKLEGVREKIADIKSHQSKLSEEIKRAEELLSKETDAINRWHLERMQPDLKPESVRLAQMEAQAREQEAQLIGQLQTEQVKLNEINERLDTLQKELEVVDKPQPGGKRQ